MDSPANTTIQEVTCTGIMPAATITTNSTGTAYMPASVTITMGQVVHFTLPTAHNAQSSTPGLMLGFGADKCLMFTATGTYNFTCTAHGFTGSITVQ